MNVWCVCVKLMKTSGYGHVIWIFKHAWEELKMQTDIQQNHHICDLTLGISLALRPISYPTKSVEYSVMKWWWEMYTRASVFSHPWKKRRGLEGSKIERMLFDRIDSKNDEKLCRKNTITKAFLFVLMRMIFSFGFSVWWVIFSWCNATDLLRICVADAEIVCSIPNVRQKYVNFNGLRERKPKQMTHTAFHHTCCVNLSSSWCNLKCINKSEKDLSQIGPLQFRLC